MATNEARSEVSSGNDNGFGLSSDFMTVKEVADYLRCHPSSIYRLLRRKKIPAFKVGFDWRFSPQAIDTWMNGRFETQRRRIKESAELTEDSTNPT
jgi:excisionase family DNA binding protein